MLPLGQMVLNGVRNITHGSTNVGGVACLVDRILLGGGVEGPTPLVDARGVPE
jgi:hypothetical protein